MDPTYEYLLQDIIQSVLYEEAQNGPLSYFTRMLYGMDAGGSRFHPDINGYTLVFLMPPDLSGYSDAGDYLDDTCKNIVFLGMDFTPPTLQVTTSEVAARSGAIPYGSEVGITGNMQFTYIDDASLSILGMHAIWLQYIEDVTRGVVSPSNKYIAGSNFGEIDYSTSAYVMRFKPTMRLTTDDIVYVGKCAGIFPINIPDKESIGRRDANELTMLPITYACTLYRQQILNTTNRVSSQNHSWVYDEFKSVILSQYESSNTQTVGAANYVSWRNREETYRA